MDLLAMKFKLPVLILSLQILSLFAHAGAGGLVGYDGPNGTGKGANYNNANSGFVTRSTTQTIASDGVARSVTMSPALATQLTRLLDIDRRAIDRAYSKSSDPSSQAWMDGYYEGAREARSENESRVNTANDTRLVKLRQWDDLVVQEVVPTLLAAIEQVKDEKLSLKTTAGMNRFNELYPDTVHAYLMARLDRRLTDESVYQSIRMAQNVVRVFIGGIDVGYAFIGPNGKIYDYGIDERFVVSKKVLDRGVLTRRGWEIN